MPAHVKTNSVSVNGTLLVFTCTALRCWYAIGAEGVKAIFGAERVKAIFKGNEKKEFNNKKPKATFLICALISSKQLHISKHHHFPLAVNIEIPSFNNRCGYMAFISGPAFASQKAVGNTECAWQQVQLFLMNSCLSEQILMVRFLL